MRGKIIRELFFAAFCTTVVHTIVICTVVRLVLTSELWPAGLVLGLCVCVCFLTRASVFDLGFIFICIFS